MSFISRVKPFKRCAALLVAILTVVSLMLIYCEAYPVRKETPALEKTISDYLSQEIYNRVLDAEVLETIDVKRGLVAFFRDKSESQIFGFALFNKGLNMRYHMYGYAMAPIPYSASIITMTTHIDKHETLYIGGYNVGGIYEYGVQYSSYVQKQLDDGTWTRESTVIILPVKKEQFFIMIPAAELIEG